MYRKIMRKYLDLKQPVNHIPSNLMDMKIICKTCNIKYKPNWLEKSISPFIPIKPNNYNGSGRWICSSVKVVCPNCTYENSFSIPLKEINSTYYLYGDEAYREIGKKQVICYTLVGTNMRFIPIINDKIYHFKKEIFPDKDPKEWTLHMKDIWAPNHRAKSIYKDFSVSQINEIVEKYFNLVKNLGNGFTIHCVSSISEIPNKVSKKFLTDKKIDIYSLLIARITQQFIEQKIKPIYTFDSEKIGQEDNIIHEWAEKAFIGFQHSLLYGYLSGGTYIETPKFVKPGSYPCLEIADFISYVIARYCFKRLLNKKVDLPPEKLGYINYLGFEKDVDFLYLYQDSYPWDIFYE